MVAVRLPLDPGPRLDPIALAGSTGTVFRTEARTLVGLGVAFTVDLPLGLDGATDVAQVSRTLAGVDCDDRFEPATSGVIAFGALPFDRTRPGYLAVPAITYGLEASGAEWVTVLAADRADLPDRSEGLRAWLAGRSTSPPLPSDAARDAARRGPTIVPHTTDSSFEAMVAESLRAVERHEVRKVVVSRQVDVRMDEPIDVAALLDRWHGIEPTASLFSMSTSGGQLVGASPELLVERTGAHVRSRPLAGTTDRTHKATSLLPRELLASSKDGTEHRLVVEAIGKALAPLCTDLEVPARPDLVHLHNITHLGTTLVGTLARRGDGSTPTALELVATLHPTPAVGGVPRDPALALISRLEPESRGHFAGPVGYVDARGDGRWMIGIRAMTVSASDALLAAGVGVVSGSDPKTELVEVNLKLTAAFHALAPGVPFTTSDGPSARQAVG
jgi:isochorismate synthase